MDSNLEMRFTDLVEGLSAFQGTVIAQVSERFITEYPAYVAPARLALDRYWKTLL